MHLAVGAQVGIEIAQEPVALLHGEAVCKLLKAVAHALDHENHREGLREILTQKGASLVSQLSTTLLRELVKEVCLVNVNVHNKLREAVTQEVEVRKLTHIGSHEVDALVKSNLLGSQRLGVSAVSKLCSRTNGDNLVNLIAGEDFLSLALARNQRLAKTRSAIILRHKEAADVAALVIADAANQYLFLFHFNPLSGGLSHRQYRPF